MTPTTDVLLGDRYRLGDLIAVGGMGEVWAATDELLQRPVAVKVLKQEYVDEPGFLERFRAEARHAGGLSHPGIATVYDYGESGRTSYLVMELVVGEPLQRLIAREAPLPFVQAIDIAAETARALHAAHAAGVVHRDVKPGNILITENGSVKVTDFGIARAVDAVPLTQTGTLLGTAHYLSPEQAAGRPVSPASDVYSLGVVLFECVTGRRPFEDGNAVAVAMAHLSSPLPGLPPDVPPALADPIVRALAKDPGDRFASAAEFADALVLARATVSDPSGVATRLAAPAAAGPATAVLPVARERRRWWPFAAAIALLLLAGLLVSALAGGGDQPGRRTPTVRSSSPAPASSTATAATVRVPDGLRGMDRAAAESAVRKAGLVARVQTAPHSAAAGTVVEVRPRAGAEVKRGSDVTLVVSAGSESGDGDDEGDEGDGDGDSADTPGNGKAKGKKKG